MSQRTCTVDGCARRHFGKGYCNMHYRRWRKHGTPGAAESRAEITMEDRFWAKVNKDGAIPDYAPHLGPCWEWTGALTERGYGLFRDTSGPEGKTASAHRTALKLAGVALIDGLVVDHLCRVHNCVNPDHLEQVTSMENTYRSPVALGAIHGRKTHCHRGHAFTDENTYWFTQRGQLGRQCRECQRINYAARKAAT